MHIHRGLDNISGRLPAGFTHDEKGTFVIVSTNIHHAIPEASLRCLQGLMFLAMASIASAGDEPNSVPTEQVQKSDESDSIFGMTRVNEVHIRVTKENWDKMAPKSGGFPGFGPPGVPTNAGGPGRPPGPPANHRPGSFGFEFEYLKADIDFNGKSFKDVGIRFKGNGTYMMSQRSRKRPIKLDFNRFVENQTLFGMQQINLHNNVMDPTHVRATLSYDVFRKAEIPAPRTGYAEVRLTIEGECEKEWIGLYSLVEEIDKAFLRRHYKTDEGMLLKPEGTQGLEYKGEDWADYAWFEPKGKPSKAQQNRLIQITRLIEKSDDETFRKEIISLLDTDQFARFLAANVLLSNMDSFLTNVHNYYVYLPPETNRFEFLPWDMDLSMGTFFLAGQPEQLANLSIDKPHVGRNRLIERLIAWDDFRTSYHQHLESLTAKCFDENGSTLTDLKTIQTSLQELIARDQKRGEEEMTKLMSEAPGGPGGFGPPRFGPPGGGRFNPFGNATPIDEFISKRRDSIRHQLVGNSKGQEPGGGFGFGPPRPR